MAEKKRNHIIAGRYKVIKALGRGGMGKVFLVEDQVDGRQYAMKLLRNQWQGNDRVIARFNREVNALKRMDHPGIVRIFTSGKEGDLMYYTMEYIEGKSIAKWLSQRRRLKFDSTVRVLSLVAAALEHAHTVTIHRDLSPDNIMVMADGSVRIVDFGLAKIFDASQNLTIVGVNLGKLQYNAPEQQINAAMVDARSDIFSLGIIFFEMLTGRRPKAGDNIEALRPSLPEGAQKFFKTATRTDPDERFQDARAFRKALMALYEGKEIDFQVTAELKTPPPVESLPETVELSQKQYSRWQYRWHRIAVFFRRLLRIKI